MLKNLKDKILYPLIVAIISGIFVAIVSIEYPTFREKFFNTHEYKENYGIESSTGEKIGLYTGDVNKDGQPDANEAILMLNDGSICKGKWDNGTPVGDFTVEFPIGDKYCTYIGAISSDYKPYDDEAKIISVNGNEYVIKEVSWVVEEYNDVSYQDHSGYVCYTGMNTDSYEYGMCYWDDGDEFVGEHLNNKRNGYGIYKYDKDDEKLSYEGYWKDNEPDGYGLRIWKNGDIYEGEFTNNQANGLGKYTWASADTKIYEGLWVNDIREGEGKMTYADGDIYEGDFEYGYPNGHGTMTYVDGDIYEGNFEYGYPNGHGTMTYVDGDIYEGNFEYGYPNGHGTMTYADGDIYEGNFEYGNPYGHGIKTYVNGDIYEGNFESGNPSGQGKYTWTWSVSGYNEPVVNYTGYYEGNFCDGQISGYGTFYPQDATPIYGYWEWLELEHITIAGYDGLYTGMTFDGLPNGYGVFTHEYVDTECSGVYRKIEGEFRYGDVHGYIKLTQTTDGERFTADGYRYFDNYTYFDNASFGQFEKKEHVYVEKISENQ